MFETRNSKSEEVGGDYLWDGTGTPDPEVQQIEKMLARFRQADELSPLRIPAAGATPSASWLSRLWLPSFAAAVTLTLMLVASLMMRRLTVGSQESAEGWNVASIEGQPQIGNGFVRRGQQASLRVGQILQTDAASRATVSSDDLGEVKIDPNSRIKLMQSDDNRKRIQLDVGRIHAMIWAPPGQFVVDTPSAVAVDLGCAYTLEVAPDGSGTIRTSMGWVGFHSNGHDSFIPAGAMCPTKPGAGPGTPYFEDASNEMKGALRELDFADGSQESREAALRLALAQARPRDGLSLWHLLFRTEGQDRVLVYERFRELVPPPAGVTRDGVLRLQSTMMDAWWNELGLGDISLWRYWEQGGTAPSNGTPAAKFQPKKNLLLKQPR